MSDAEYMTVEDSLRAERDEALARVKELEDRLNARGMSVSPDLDIMRLIRQRDIALVRVKELEETVEAQKRGDAHDTIREMLAPLGIGPHDDVVQSVRELVARTLPADTVRQVREALDFATRGRKSVSYAQWPPEWHRADAALELLKEDKARKKR